MSVLFFPSLPLELGPLNTGPGERCKLPRRGLGQSPRGFWGRALGEIEFGAFQTALKSDIRWFY